MSSYLNPITLIITAGTAPAVITEMIYVIHKEQIGEIQDIKVITTAKGQEDAQKKLLDLDVQNNSIGALYLLAKELGVTHFDLKLNNESFYVPVNHMGEPLNDIRTREDDLAFATLTNRIVRDACANEERTVIACQAGGRKTMGAHLLSAMQVYGRKQDKIYHILVNEPFESCSDFYFPTKESKMCSHFRDKSIQADAKDAKIDLIDIPFLRLRTHLEESLSNIDFKKDYHEVLESIDNYLKSQPIQPIRKLWFDFSTRTVYVNKHHEDYKVKLEPKPFTFLLFLVVLKAIPDFPDKINFEGFQKDIKVRLLWHLLYNLIISKTAEDDDLFDLERTDAKRAEELALNPTSRKFDALNGWKKMKSDLKGKLEKQLELIPPFSKQVKPVVYTDLFYDDSAQKRGVATSNESWFTAPVELIEFESVRFQTLQNYIETEFFELFQSVKRKDITFFTSYDEDEVSELVFQISEALEQLLIGD